MLLASYYILISVLHYVYIIEERITSLVKWLSVDMTPDTEVTPRSNFIPVKRDYLNYAGKARGNFRQNLERKRVSASLNEVARIS